MKKKSLIYLQIQKYILESWQIVDQHNPNNRKSKKTLPLSSYKIWGKDSLISFFLPHIKLRFRTKLNNGGELELRIEFVKCSWKF